LDSALATFVLCDRDGLKLFDWVLNSIMDAGVLLPIADDPLVILAVLDTADTVSVHALELPSILGTTKIINIINVVQQVCAK